MKKLMFAAVAVLGLSAFATIESTNIVGYQNKGLASGTYTMLNVPFQHVSNDGKGLMLNSDITVLNVTGDADDYRNADQIWIWNPTTESYVSFFYYDDGDEAGWSITTGGQEYIEELTEWEAGIPSGTAMYYKAKTGAGKKAVFGKTW